MTLGAEWVDMALGWLSVGPERPSGWKVLASEGSRHRVSKHRQQRFPSCDIMM